MSESDWKYLESIKQHIIDGNAIASIWSIEDILEEHDISREQARGVLQSLIDNHDACIGINWEVIRYAYTEEKNDG